MPDDVLRDLRQTVDALERKLGERTAERDQRTQELARREAELRASEERYGLVIQAVAEGIYDWDIERNSLRPSARLIEIFGFHGRDLTAADWNELVHPETTRITERPCATASRRSRRGSIANTGCATATAPIAGSRIALSRCATPPAGRFG
jgi:PAS domain-containing protein